MHWVRNIHVAHMQWQLLQSYHMPSMPETPSQWLGIYFRKVPSAKGAQIRSDRERAGAGAGAGAGAATATATATAAAAAREVYLLLIVLWHLGETACIQPDLGPSQLHPIAIHQYWSFFAEHGQL
jgi:hypothetical protein